MTNDTVSTYWCTVINGKIRGVGTGFPPHKLHRNQFDLTEQEFYLLKSIKEMDMTTLLKVVKSIQKKMKGLEKR